MKCDSPCQNGGRLWIERLDFSGRMRVGRQIQEDVARNDLEVTRLFAHGDQLAIQRHVIALGVLAPDGDFEKMERVGDG